MDLTTKERRAIKPLLRAVIEIGSILFLFYSNLLMGEFTRGSGQGKSLVVALVDICTAANLGIGLVSATVGYVAFEYLRKRV